MSLRTLPRLLPILCLSAALLACNGDSSRGEEGEGEGEGEGEDLGAPDLARDAELSDAATDQGPADDGVDQWEDRVRKKDGIGPRPRATALERIVVVFSRPTESGTSRRLCYWRGSSPEDPAPETGCLNLRIGNPSTPYLAADGTWLTFVEAGGGAALLANVDTGAVETALQVTGGDDFALRNPVVSSGGRFIAFQKEFQGMAHIGLLDRENGTETMLWEQQGNTGAPTISADGSLVAFHSNPTGNNDIWRWDAATSETTNVTGESVAHEKVPRISRDGGVLCFRQSAQAEGRVGQVVVAADGQLRDITSGYALSQLNNFDCQPSATGRHIVFRSLPGQVQSTRWAEGGNFYVYDMNADEHRLLYEPQGIDSSKPHSPWVLSSDGRWIVFTAAPQGSSDPDLWFLGVHDGRTYRIRSPEAEGTGIPGVN